MVSVGFGRGKLAWSLEVAVTHLVSTCWSRSATELSMRKMFISSSEKERATVLSSELMVSRRCCFWDSMSSCWRCWSMVCCAVGAWVCAGYDGEGLDEARFQ